jgi:hypothetical protein
MSDLDDMMGFEDEDDPLATAEEVGGSRIAGRVVEVLAHALGGDYRVEVLSQSDPGGIRERLNHRLATMELRRQKNLESIALHAMEAADELEDDDTAESVDDDWMIRFVGYAQDVENEDLRRVWSRVLARETASPGAVGLPAVDCLGAMTPDDTDLCRRMARIAFPTGLLLKIPGTDGFADFGVDRDDLDRLRGLRLLSEGDDLSVTFEAPTGGLTLDYRDADLVIRHPENESFTLPVFTLTRPGRDLLACIGEEPADRGYLAALAEGLRELGYDHRLKDAA